MSMEQAHRSFFLRITQLSSTTCLRLAFSEHSKEKKNHKYHRMWHTENITGYTRRSSRPRAVIRLQVNRASAHAAMKTKSKTNWASRFDCEVRLWGTRLAAFMQTRANPSTASPSMNSIRLYPHCDPSPSVWIFDWYFIIVTQRTRSRTPTPKLRFVFAGTHVLER